ncbi:unnamed protein product, partial [Pylaiella littoralis]
MVNPTQTKIDTFFPGQSASPRASPRPGALASRPVNSSPQKSCAESSGQPTAPEGKKRKKPTSSKGKNPSNIRHRYRGVPDQYKKMTTARLREDGHIATGTFSYDHLQFAREAAAFNDVKVEGKPVWQQQPSGPSTLHNNITITERFSSMAPFLRGLEGLCKPRPTTDGAVNPFQLKADGTPDAERFDCPSGSYHIMDPVATGLDSHAHHQAIIDKTLLSTHGALTTFVIDLDPAKPDTFIEDVAEIARGTADEVRAGVGVSAYVPPPTPEQIGQSCGSTQTADWNKLQQEENLESYIQDRRDGGENAIKKRKEDNEKFTDDCSRGGENAIKKRKEDNEKFTDDCSRGGAAGDKTLYGREKGGDGRSLSSEQGASIRPADTS